MNLRWLRRPAAQPPVLHANPTRIAVLEHDLLGIPPRPGSAAALTIALRAAGTCIEHDPADIGTLGDRPGTRVLCTRCGNHLVAGDSGGWAIAAIPAPEEAP